MEIEVPWSESMEADKLDHSRPFKMKLRKKVTIYISPVDSKANQEYTQYFP